MSGGRAGALSPAYAPVFNPDAVRGETRVRKQGGGGGVGEFTFQYNWPGLINYTATSPVIYNIAEKTILSVWWTLIDYPTSSISVALYVNGVLNWSNTINSNGYTDIEGLVIPPFAVVGIVITGVGTGDGSGLWIGFSESPLPDLGLM